MQCSATSGRDRETAKKVRTKVKIGKSLGLQTHRVMASPRMFSHEPGDNHTRASPVMYVPDTHRDFFTSFQREIKYNTLLLVLFIFYCSGTKTTNWMQRKGRVKYT